MKKNKKRTIAAPKINDLIVNFFILLIFLLVKIGDSVKWLMASLRANTVRAAIFTLRLFRQSFYSFLAMTKAWIRAFLPDGRHGAEITKKIKRLLKIRLPRPHLWLNLAMTIGFLKNLTSYFRIQLPTSHVLHLVKILNTKYHRLTTSHRRTTILYSASRRVKLKWFSLGLFFCFFFFLIPLLSYSWLSALPDPHRLSIFPVPVTTKIFDRHGILLYEIYETENRTPVKLSLIPKNLINATIATEDQEFYSHPGFSIRGILRAFYQTVFNHNSQGGSTITQQLIRSVYLTPEPTLTRKLKELVLSFWAERIYSKDQILEMYFNQIPYGSTAWGAEAASQLYFGKKVTDLNLAQAAYLAGLPGAPSLYFPYGTHPDSGLSRQKEVLKLMRKLNFIDQKTYQSALSQTLIFNLPKTKILAPHFVMYVRNLLEEEFGREIVQTGGLRVITSLDLKLQTMAENVVKTEVEKLKNLKVGNGAALIINPKTGEILSMVGSKDYFDTSADGNVNLTTALRQPGSAIKVINYAAALENGLTAATLLEDTPVTFTIPGQPNYTPVNYDGRFHGKVSLRTALANSYNIPAVKVLKELGVGEMIEKGQEMGVTSWTDPNRYGLSLTLGGGEVTMLEMATVYGTLANLGKKQELNPILKITDYRGQILSKIQTTFPNPAVTPDVAFILNDILADDHARSLTFGQNSLLKIPDKTVSVKTGTTNNLRDNWAIGYTPSYVVAVWVGNNDNSSMSGIASGVTGATPIWHNIMQNLLKDKKDEPFKQPAGVIRSQACGKSDFFVSGTEKLVVCPPPPSPSPSPAPNP